MWYPIGTFWCVYAGVIEDRADHNLVDIPKRHRALARFRALLQCDTTRRKRRVSCSASNCAVPQLQQCRGAARALAAVEWAGAIGLDSIPIKDSVQCLFRWSASIPFSTE